jgi:hypothetical protein
MKPIIKLSNLQCHWCNLSAQICGQRIGSRLFETREIFFAFRRKRLSAHAIQFAVSKIFVAGRQCLSAREQQQRHNDLFQGFASWVNVSVRQ